MLILFISRVIVVLSLIFGVATASSRSSSKTQANSTSKSSSVSTQKPSPIMYFLDQKKFNYVIQSTTKSWLADNLQRPKRLQRRQVEENLNETNSYENSSVFANETIDEEWKEKYLKDITDFIFPRPWTWALIILHTVVFVIGLVGNALVCVAVYRNHTMRTVTNYFIVNLAVADFLVILLCLPPTVIWDVTMTWFLGVIMCKIGVYLQTVSVTVSVLTLTFISVDRWYAICFPLRFKSTTGRAKTAIGIIWLIALLFDIPEFVVYTTKPNKKLEIETIYFTQCEPTWSLDTDRNWMLLKMILLYAVPLIFMTVAYCQIIRVLWKSGNVHQHSLDVSGGRHVNTFTMNTNTSTEGQLRSRRKAAKMLVAVVIMFAVCYFPVHVLSVLRATITLSNTEINRAFFCISHWLCYANSAVNPIIYNFMSGKFRKEFRRAFDHCCQPTTGNQRGGYQLSNMYPQNTEKDSGIASRTQSRSSKRTLTEVRRLGKGFPDSHSSRRQSVRTIVSKIDV